MESQSFDKEVVLDILDHISDSIEQLQKWNSDVKSIDDWLLSSTGMQNLAANCMLIIAIGEAVGKIEKYAGKEFLNNCSDIPWHEIKGMRNHIAHGYFEIDAEYVLGVIKNDLDPLLTAVNKLIQILEHDNS